MKRHQSRHQPCLLLRRKPLVSMDSLEKAKPNHSSLLSFPPSFFSSAQSNLSLFVPYKQPTKHKIVASIPYFIRKQSPYKLAKVGSGAVNDVFKELNQIFNHWVNKTDMVLALMSLAQIHHQVSGFYRNKYI